ncbi:unnamed protein product [Phytophthora fragariaefolia]|uniref:Unnamed protein product n=1 Tax=Phytophthora fragariaefolia TaxID=1490495 RepID=A0A9W6TZX0_9STRA|nr:unnamed protein product [Phytophthora fragariaefolia]
MQLPRTRADLQQFLCAVNWMRQSIPEYTRISAVLYDALERAAIVSGSRKKKMLAKVDLVDVSWGAQETAGFVDIRQALLRMVPLTHSSPSSEVCLYSDANQDFWGAVVTQLEMDEVQRPLKEQHHQPLVSGAGDLLEQRQDHVPGEANAWGDLLGRWGAGSALKQERTSRRVAQLPVVQRVSPLEGPEFVGAAETEIRVLQQVARDDNSDLQGAQWSEHRQLLLTAAGQVWIPGDDTDMQQRLCVVAHAGASDHRGSRVTTQALEAVFYWRTMAKDVAEFVAGCLHCMSTASGRIPRPFSEAWKATKPNKVLHFDYLTMVEGEGGIKYILRALGAQHHFTTAYTPWANGTVEVVNREVLKRVKALLSERKLPVRDWPSVLPVVKSALNEMPADRLGGKSPLTAFTALPGGAQLQHILLPRDPADTTVQWVDQEIPARLSKFELPWMGCMQKWLMTDKRRRVPRARHERRQGVKLQKISECDFVLAATATGRSGHKVALV